MNIKIELESLITEREGMLAENTFRSNLGQGIAYGDKAFQELADRIRALAPNQALKPDAEGQCPFVRCRYARLCTSPCAWSQESRTA